MASALKCPNPSCPYLFDPTTVPPGVVLACPRCGMRFTLGPPVPPPAAPSPAEAAATATFPGTPRGYTAPPPPPPGYARPGYSAPAPPANAPFSEMTPEAAKPDGEEGPRLPVRSSKFQTALLVAVAAVALAAAGVAVWWKLSSRDDVAESPTAQRFKDENLSFDPPPAPWTRDEDTRAKLGLPFIFVYRRDNPEAVMAFGVKDFKTTEPRPSDLEKPLTRVLRKLIDPTTLKMYLDHDDVEPTWLGQPARKRFKFTGVLRTGGAVEGQVVAVSYKGLGYWFLSWTGSADIYEEQKAAFAGGRKRLKLLELREGWKETQPSVVEFKGDTVAYSISDGEGIWKEVADAGDRMGQDPKADKFLRAKIKDEGQDFGREAELLVLVLDAEGADPLDQARRYVEGQVNRDVELTGRVKFEPHTEDTRFDAPNPVPGNAPFVLLKGTNERSRQGRLWAISAIRVGDKTVAASASCLFTEDERREFERKFVELVKSLKATG